MRSFFVAILILTMAPFSYAFGQEEPLLSDQPLCMNLYNTAPYLVRGSVLTDTTPNAEGDEVRHQVEFKIKPEEKRQFCSLGPFFPGYRLELVLRSLFPVFSCRTQLQGEITIRTIPLEDGGNKLIADCL